MAKINKATVQLESFLREKIREAIVEEMTLLNEWDPEEWDERGQHGPEHGESKPDNETGEMLVWDGMRGRWTDEGSWEQEYGQGTIHQQELDTSGQPVSELSPEDPDPELGMDPAERQRMIDSMLSMEFDENKQIQMEHLNKMIKESVKRFLKSTSEKK